MPKKPRFPQEVCKPCWELKYCPYGILVEEFPIDPDSYPLTHVRERYDEVIAGFARGDFKTREQIADMIQVLMYHVPENWEVMQEYDTSELECNVFGHICPVFFVAEGATETAEGRRPPSRYIPRDVMLKVVRRDGQMCQVCGRNVPDRELHLDHLIPVSRGGTSSVENLRVLCAQCNRDKSDSLSEVLGKPYKRADGVEE